MTLKCLPSLGSLRRNIALIALFFDLSITFIFLAAGAWTGTLSLTKAGGAFGIVAALIAYYCALSDLLVKNESWFTIPLGVIKQGRED